MSIGDVKGELLDEAVRQVWPRREDAARDNQAALAVEFGTFIGYSSVRIARLLPRQVRFISVDPNQKSMDAARAMLNAAGLLEKVELVQKESSASLRSIAASGDKINFMFIDHDKRFYKADLELAMSLGVLADGCVIVTDNVRFPVPLKSFKQLVTTDSHFSTTVHETYKEYSKKYKDEVTVSIYHELESKEDGNFSCCSDCLSCKVKGMLESATFGDPESILKVVDDYGWANKNAGPSHIMSIGDVKGEILDEAVRQVWPRREDATRDNQAALAVEFGTFIGYSSVRIARLLPRKVRFISVDPNRKSMDAARAMLNAAGLLEKVELVQKESSASLRSIAASGDKINFMFIDHDKRFYKADLELAMSLGVLADGCVIVADNVQFPVPLKSFKQLVTTDSHFSTKVHETYKEYSKEYADEVTVSIYRELESKEDGSISCCSDCLSCKVTGMLESATPGDPESILKVVDDYGWANKNAGPSHIMSIGDVK